jgi:hypothetical protein
MKKKTAARELFLSKQARAAELIQQIIDSQPHHDFQPHENKLALLLQLRELQSEIEGPPPRWRREAFKNFIRHRHWCYALDDLGLDWTNGAAAVWVSKQLKGTPWKGAPGTMVRAFFEHEKTLPPEQRRKRKPRGPNRKI